MSLILDALSRAEREKREQASAAPTILSQESGAAEPSTHRRTVTFLVIVGLLMATATGLYILYGKEPAAPPVVVSAQPEAGNPGARADLQGLFDDRQAQLETERRESARVESARAESARAESARVVAELYARPADGEIEGERDSSPGRLESSRAESRTAVETATVRPVTDDVNNDVNNDVIDVEEVLQKVRAEAARATPEEHPAPLLEDLPKQFKDRVPTLMYSLHDYAAAGRSSVIINGASLVPGQRTRGVEVLEILAESVVLRFESTDFRLRSLNSWVNL